MIKNKTSLLLWEMINEIEKEIGSENSYSFKPGFINCVKQEGNKTVIEARLMKDRIVARFKEQ